MGSWAARHRWLVLASWVGALILATVAHHLAGGTYSDTLTIPGSKAQAGLNVLRAHERAAGGQTGQVVFVDRREKLSSQRSAVERSIANVRKLDHVLSATDPLSRASVSSDGQIAYSSVHFDTNPQSLGEDYMTDVDRAVKPARAAGIAVSYGGQLGQAAAPKASDITSEAIGIAIGLLTLLLAFGSVIAAVTPLLTSLLAVVTGIGVLGVLAASISFGTAAPTLATMMGLGVGIDYALFLTTRNRQLLIDGTDFPAAMRHTMAASGRSVLIAGSTVIIAMLGLYASGISFIGKLGLAAAITVAVAMLAGLTLAPALLGLARTQIDRLHVRTPIAEPRAANSPLHRYTATVAGHPWLFALGGLALMLVIAIPTLSMNLGHVGPGSEPRSYSERQAYDAISRGFGVGANGPLTIVVSLAPHTSSHTATSVGDSVQRSLAATAGVRSAAPLKPSRDGAVLVGDVLPDGGPTADSTRALVRRLQDDVLPAALRGSHATGFVTGTTAATIDFENTVSSRLPVIIGVVVLAAFVLLLASFRSVVVAVKAALLNLVSIAAACGVIVAAFQWGWATSLLGISGDVPIESYVPMIIFAIVFGLSMDYEVFLVSRIREHWCRGASNQESVANGLAETARVISCAALILACVFFSFLLSTSVTVKMLALGLGVSVLLDATVIRMVIVPALMFLFDRVNWWIPAWLGRLLPRLEAESGPLSPTSGPAVARVGQP